MKTNESKMVRFSEDEIILRQGCTEKVMYKILHGKAEVYLNYGQKDEYLVCILAEQRCFGEFSILCGKPSIYTVVAYSDVLLLRITEEDFDSFVRNNSANAVDIMRNLASTIVAMNANMNIILEELSQANSIEPERIREITKRIQQSTPIMPENSSTVTFYG